MEDRLLLKMNSSEASAQKTEYLLWLTRRYSGLLWGVLKRMEEEEIAKDPSVTESSREAMKEFKKEAALSEADFKTPYSSEEANTPLGTAPILLSKIQTKTTDKKAQVLVLLPAEGQGINLTVNITIIHLLQKLLKDAVKKAEWGLNLEGTVDGKIIVQTPRTIN